mmetsp:Transcript_14966/g.22773  ORF Transcript_14966/g.22773 Transcript_14966/m.22773 type:complete len:237 (+) Transcript_14966:225-935(+)
MHLEAHVFQLAVLQDVSPIEDEGRLHHESFEFVVGIGSELVPLGQNHDGMCPIHRFLRSGLPNQAILIHLHVMVLEFYKCIFFLDFRIVDVNHSSVLQEHVAHGQCWRFPHIARVFLEGEAEDSDLLVRHGVEQAGNELGAKSLLLVLVHVHHLLPILGTSWQPLGFADINQIQNVLLEAGAAEADGGIQELGADPRVGTDGARDLCHICTCLLAEQRDGVDAADPLSQHSIRDQL